MPIVEPNGFGALNFIPFQINPHFLDAKQQNHGGETREERILEFVQINKTTTVVGLREGCMFFISDNSITYKGVDSLRVFQYGKEPYEVKPGDNFNFFV